MDTTALNRTQKKELCLEYAQLKTLQNAVNLRINDLHSAITDIMHQDYLEDGVEKRTAKVGNTVVGTLSVVKDKGYTITDPDAFIEWLESYDLGYGAYRAYDKTDREIYSLLRKHYSAEELEHLFWVEPVAYKETEKRIICCDDVCLLEGMPEAIPGIKPKADTFKYVRVTDTNLTKCISSLNAGDDGMKKLLSRPLEDTK